MTFSLSVVSMIESVHPYTDLDPEAVLQAIEQVGYETDARVLALNSYENRVYQIGIYDQPPVIAKFYRPGRWSTEQILEEHQYSAELSALEIPVIAPLPFESGSTVSEFRDFQFALFPQFVGRPPELDNLDNLLVMGRFIGRIHSVGSLKNFEYRRQFSHRHLSEESSRFLLENDFIPLELINAYESLSRDLIERTNSLFADQGELQLLRIHGDCHPGNVLWKDDTPNFVDFDDTIMGPAMQDLWMLLSGDRNQKQAQLLEIVEGYNEFHDFKAKELSLIESLRTLRLMHYSAWLARRWEDPAFPQSFPWFNTAKYWSEHILELREQLAALDEPPLELI